MRSPAEFEAAKRAVKTVLAMHVALRSSVLLAEAQAELRVELPELIDLIDNGLFVAKMLNAIGWQRLQADAMSGDRRPRYVPTGARR